MSNKQPVTLILGAGISGLAAAYYAQKKGKTVQVLEASPNSGGFVQTKITDRYQIELAPNTLMADSHTLTLIKELGLEDQIVYPSEVSKKRYIYKNGSITQLPENPKDLLLGNFFSLSTKIKILKSLFAKPKKTNPLETLAQTIESQFGEEVVNLALAPFVTGIYGSSPEELLTSITFPQIQKAQSETGSILKGMMRQAKGTARRQSLNFKGGLAQLISKLTEALDSIIQYNSRVISIEKSGEGFTVQYQVEDLIYAFYADELIFTLPFHQVPTLLKDIMPHTALAMMEVPSKTMYSVHTVWKRNSTTFLFNGFGCLHIPKENLFSAGAIWVSATFPHCAPADEIMLCSFVIRDGKQDLLSEAEIMPQVIADMQKIYGFKSSPVFTHFGTWHKALPVYGKELLNTWKTLESEIPENFQFSTNWYKGVSLNDCLKEKK